MKRDLNVKRVYKEYGKNVPFKYKQLKKRLSTSCQCDICGDKFQESPVFGESLDPIVLSNLEHLVCNNCYNGLAYFGFNIKNLTKAITMVRDITSIE